MKIIEQAKNTKRFSELAFGEVFRHRGVYYMKTDEIRCENQNLVHGEILINAVDLINGYLQEFDNVEVEPVDCELVIK